MALNIDTIDEMSYKTLIMDKHLQTLEKRFGSKKDVAKALGITLRHYHRILQTKKASGPLKKLIFIMARPDKTQDAA